MDGISRRDMATLMMLASCGSILGQDRLSTGAGSVNLGSLEFKDEQRVRAVEAMFWEKAGQDKKVVCKLCPQECVVADQERGTCGVRENRGGKYYTLVHSQICAAHIDPIEKKPMFHYLPGTDAFSIATPGCNMECKYCQNWQISQFRPEQVPCQTVPPEKIVAIARQNRTPTIAYTYSEPVIFYEYMVDIAVEAKRAGIGNVMITSGYISKDPLKKLIPKLSAIKVDFKGYSEDFYRDVCRGKLKPVLDALETIVASGLWLEIVILIVPTMNDSVAENKRMYQWIRKYLGTDVPVHLTRFHPTYKLKNLPSTPVATLERLRKEALNAGLKFVYIGNVWGHPSESTYCPSCNTLLIRRVGFNVVENNIQNRRCSKCGTVIPGVFH